MKPSRHIRSQFCACMMPAASNPIHTLIALFPRDLDVLQPIGEAIFPVAPTRIHTVRRSLHDGLDLMQLGVADLEQFHNLPRPRLLWSAGYFAAIGRLEVSCVTRGVVEKAEGKHQAAIRVGDISSV